MENYKEKYENALATARKLYNEAKANEYTSDIEDYEAIFPELAESDDTTIPFGAADSELIEEIYYIPEGMEAVIDGDKVIIKRKESEDERIRKGIIKSLMDLNTDWLELHGVTKENALAWLEKQGEQKLTEGNFVNVGDVRDEFVRNVYMILDADSTNDRANQIIEVFDTLPTVQIEQKPVWSEEDEKMVDVISWFLEQTEYTNHNCIWKSETIDWLKSLQNRIQPQPKQEWSKEDSLHYTNILQTLEHSKGCLSDYDKIETVKSSINWLKSLRPQKQWKPSKEQMVAIDTAINVLGKGTLNGKQLIELQESLRELREG